MKRLLLLSTVMICTLLLPATAQDLRFFEFGFRNITDDNFNVIAATSDPDVLAVVDEQLALPVEERNMFINGSIARGTEHNNPRYTWHFVTNQWELVEIAVEVCDGNPQDVENDPDYWVDVLGYYCPWSSFVQEEIFPSNVDEEEAGHGVSIRYDPVGEVLTVTRGEDLETVQLLLVNSIGEEMWLGQLHAGDDRTDVSSAKLGGGVYFVVVSSRRHRFVVKFLKS